MKFIIFYNPSMMFPERKRQLERNVLRVFFFIKKKKASETFVLLFFRFISLNHVMLRTDQNRLPLMICLFDCFEFCISDQALVQLLDFKKQPQTKNRFMLAFSIKQRDHGNPRFLIYDLLDDISSCEHQRIAKIKEKKLNTAAEVS